MKRIFLKTGLFFYLVITTGCENYSPTKRDVGAAGGAALGAGLGAIVGSEVGNTGSGLAIGAAAGALVGGVVGHTQDQQDMQTSEHSEILQRQQQEIDRQQKEIEDLRRQQYHDDRVKGYARSSQRNTGVPVTSYEPSSPTTTDYNKKPTVQEYDSWGTSASGSGAIHREGLDDSFSRQPDKSRY
jgi:uncharacterized protein YcfJ